MIIILLAAAFLPAILLWFYIWKKDTQKEPTSLLVKAALGGIILVAILESGIEAMLFGVEGKLTSLFVTATMAFMWQRCRRRTEGCRICIFLPVLAHGTYDALAMSGIVSPVIRGLSFFVLIYFCVKMHKVAKAKVLALVEKDNDRIKV